MSRVAYVNGVYRPHRDAVVHVEDRGYQFADGVYEVWSVFDGRLADFDAHMTRLHRSLGELRIRIPMTREALTQVLRETVRRNRVRDGLVYIQVTRGTARRDHVFPGEETAPSVVVTARPMDMRKAEASAKKGVAVITQPDIRWGRCDIKSVNLLPNVLAKQAATAAGAFEAVFVRDGIVTEGAQTTAFAVIDGVLRTHPLSNRILPSVTRAVVLELAQAQGIAVREEAFDEAAMHAAAEVFVASTTADVMPVTRIDGQLVAGGVPGPVSRALSEALAARLGRSLAREAVAAGA